jgi:hypothetical protein
MSRAKRYTWQNQCFWHVTARRVVRVTQLYRGMRSRHLHGTKSAIPLPCRWKRDPSQKCDTTQHYIWADSNIHSSFHDCKCVYEWDSGGTALLACHVFTNVIKLLTAVHYILMKPCSVHYYKCYIFCWTAVLNCINSYVAKQASQDKVRPSNPSLKFRPPFHHIFLVP